LYLGFTDQESKLWLGGFDYEQIRKSLSGQISDGVGSENSSMEVSKQFKSMSNDELESQIAWVK
jgi:hypothetical protein